MISFNSLTKAQYDALSAITTDRIYFLTDTGELKLNGVDYGETPELSSLVPSGGTVGQVLTKTADGSEWADAQGGGGDATEGNPDYLNFILEPNASVKLVKNGNPPEVNLEYSWDKLNWTEYVIGEEVTNEDSTLWKNCYFRGNNNAFSSSSSNYYNFVFKGALGFVQGNIMSLLDKSCVSKTIPTEYCFYALFRLEQEAGIRAFKVMLPAVVLQISCYGDLLASQTNCVSNFPALPATTLTESCYSGMFYGCNLMKGKVYLPAITPVRYCYNRNV